MREPLAKRCFAAFPSASRGKGEVYYRLGRVSLYVVENGMLTASVRGSGHTYTVTLDWRNIERDKSIQVFCSCPAYRDGNFCKHLWAVLRKTDAQGYSAMVPGHGGVSLKLDEDVIAAGNESLEEEEVPFELFDDEGALQPDFDEDTESSADEESDEATKAKPGWEWQVRSILRRGQRPVEPSPLVSAAREASRTGYYVINAEQSRRRGSLVVDFWVEEKGAAGRPGRRKPFKVGRRDIATFPDPADRELLTVLLGQESAGQESAGYRYHNPRWGWAQVPAELMPLLLPRLVATGRFVLPSDPTGLRPAGTPPPPFTKLRADWERPYRFQLEIVPNPTGGYGLVGALLRDGEKIDVTEPDLVLEDGTLCLGDRIARLEGPELFHWLRALREERPIHIPEEEARDAVAALLTTSGVPDLELPEALRWEEVRPLPQAKAQFHGPESAAGAIRVTIGFSYDGVEAPSSSARRALLDPAKRRIVHRDLAAERAFLEMAREVAPSALQPLSENSFSLDPRFCSDVAEGFLRLGWQVVAEGKAVKSPSRFRVAVSSHLDWFELKAGLEFGDRKLALPELLAFVKKGQRFIPLGDDKMGMIPERWLERYAPLASLGTKEKEGLRFGNAQAILLDAWLSGEKALEADQGFRDYQQKLRQFAHVAPLDPSPSFRGELRAYQRDGLGWLTALESFGLGGILADDMGLGKTVQCLAFLARIKESREERLPSIAVVPKSIVFNWREEAQRFTPGLKVMSYTGAARKQSLERIREHDLVITTYQTLRRDIDTLKEISFECAILDEAQSIKNAQALTARACRMIQARFRCAMTGTPIENSVRDLFSILEFVNPGLLGKGFRKLLLDSSDKTGNRFEELEPVARALKPFILRRTKEMVLSELPEKTEQCLFCPLGSRERKAYDELRDHYRAKLSRAIEENGLQRSKFHVLEALLRLRQAACHPALLDEKRIHERSGKLDTLLLHVQEVINEGHKALVFSQFTSFLAIVKHHLGELGIRYEYLDGQTRDRKTPVTRFQECDDSRLFLVSLKAGGLGLNLTSADYVFLLDPWWNPAVEAQAIDRAHRIGQTRKVFAYRLIAPNTVEEKILTLQAGKRELALALVSPDADGRLLSQLSVEDIQTLLS